MHAFALLYVANFPKPCRVSYGLAFELVNCRIGSASNRDNLTMNETFYSYLLKHTLIVFIVMI